MDAYGADDIIGSYSTDSQQDPPQRQQQHQQSSANAERPTVGRSQSSNGHKERERTSSKKKSDMPLDVIDRLDISGLYGGGCEFQQDRYLLSRDTDTLQIMAALQRHDGPYAAATASRNQGPRAPMAAFDPAALAPPGAVPSRPSAAPRKSSKNLSARAQATLAAMDDYDGAGRDGPYGGAAKPGQQSRRRGSDPLVTMGYPDRKAGKGAQLIEMYGVRSVISEQVATMPKLISTISIVMSKRGRIMDEEITKVAITVGRLRGRALFRLASARRIEWNELSLFGTSRCVLGDTGLEPDNS